MALDIQDNSSLFSTRKDLYHLDHLKFAKLQKIKKYRYVPWNNLSTAGVNVMIISSNQGFLSLDYREIYGLNVSNWYGLVQLTSPISLYEIIYVHMKIIFFSYWMNDLYALNECSISRITEFPGQGPETRSFDVLFDLRLNQQFSKQWRHRWFETPSSSLWRHCNDSIFTKFMQPYSAYIVSSRHCYLKIFPKNQ